MSYALRFAVLFALVFAASGCAVDATESVGTNGAGLATAQPYVKLRWAQAQLTTLPGPGYTQVALAAAGVIEVENVAYDKQLVVHYQGASGWVDVAATYAGPAYGNHELWKFTTGTIDYLPYFGNARLPFAIRYTVNGTTVWDNNAGADYAVWGPGNGGELVSPVALGQDKLKVSLSSLGVRGDASVFSGEVVLKNVAYQKNVSVVYTSDGWRTVHTIPARFQYLYDFSPSLENWTFSATLSGNVPKVEFAVSYSVNGVTYWDSLDGANYVASAQ